MNHPDQDSTYAAFAAVLVLLLSAEACPREPPPENGDAPVTATRLTGALLEYHRADPKLVWSFTEETFVLDIGGETVPWELIETLTGKRTTVARIEGTWTLNKEDGVLNLLTTQVDGKAIRCKSRLSIFAAGRVRVDLGDYQYNIFPGKAEVAELGPKLVFERVGEDLIITMTIEIPDAPHVVWTHTGLVEDGDPYLEGPRRPPILTGVELSYHVIQCRDDPVLLHMRHRKKELKVFWRLINHQKADVPYRVVDHFDPSAAELAELAPKLVKIAEETRQRAPLGVP